MAEVHDLITSAGKEAALRADLDRSVVEAAASYLGDEAGGIGFLYSGWCQAALPHRRLADAEVWQVADERLRLVVEPGLRPGPAGALAPVGVPYGSRARLIMLYLQSEALRTGSRDVALGRDMSDWLERLGISSGGKSHRDVREQADRITRCRFTFHIASSKSGGSVGLVNQNVVDRAMFTPTAEEGRRELFVEVARLSEGFFEMLKKHPVPLEEAAVRAISNNSVALDAYAWLAYRLHALQKSTPVSWSALKAQFGADYTRMNNFRSRFMPNLRLALAVYPAARVDETERGITLHPSRPPVAPKLFPAAGGPAATKVHRASR